MPEVILKGLPYQIFGMNNVKVSQPFKRIIKPLLKKYHTLKESINGLAEELKINPYLGESYGDNLYKIRLADKSKGKGKRGGFRVIYYLAIINEDGITILLLTIYNKSVRDTIDKKEVKLILKEAIDDIN